MVLDKTSIYESMSWTCLIFLHVVLILFSILTTIDHTSKLLFLYLSIRQWHSSGTLGYCWSKLTRNIKDQQCIKLRIRLYFPLICMSNNFIRASTEPGNWRTVDNKNCISKPLELETSRAESSSRPFNFLKCIFFACVQYHLWYSNFSSYQIYDFPFYESVPFAHFLQRQLTAIRLYS